MSLKKVDRETLCKRCGECCRLKYADGAIFAVGERYCPFLDWLPDGRAHCKVYGENVHRKIPLGEEETICLSADELAEIGLLPQTCSYVKEIPNYHCRVIGYKEAAA